MGNIIKNKIKEVRETYLRLRRCKYTRQLKELIPEDTSIFAMNCFGGHFNQALHRKYNTPTAGLFFYAPDFNKIISDINIIRRPIYFTDKSKFPDCIDPDYPIGVFEGTDIEIHFLHYPSPEIALEKWNRRLKRFNFNKWIAVGFCQNLWNEETIKEFAALEHPNKIMFTNGISIFPNVIACTEFKNLDTSPSAYLKGHVYYKYLTAYLKKFPIVTTDTCNPNKARQPLYERHS